MARQLSDRIAEAMRLERVGLARPLWADFSEDQKEDWLRRADELLRLLKGLGVFVAVKER